MPRPLRKLKPDGTQYFRRERVEAEIKALAEVDITEFERRANLWLANDPEFVSPEALLYFVRNAVSDTHRESLTGALLIRLARLVPSAANSSDDVISLTKINISEDVRDHFIDLLLSDRKNYDDRLDYYEVNFNGAVAADRSDANQRHRKQEKRAAELETDDGEVSAEVESAAGDYDPFDADELDKKDYRLLLDEAIDKLPEFQKRIVLMWRQDIPIESNDPSVASISNVLGKSEKTIRTHRDKAFAALKLRLERKGRI